MSGVDYVSAGPQPLLMCRKDGAVEILHATGKPSALIGGNPWEGRATRLAEGDTLLLYSDGLVELRNDVGEEFGEGRVADVLRRGGPASEIADRLLRAIEGFHDLDRLDDDLSLIVLQRRTP
jgi:sigma-B regulation protein RsbU (phosphoserine phosphatase)